jgi:hypothetical protein
MLFCAQPAISHADFTGTLNHGKRHYAIDSQTRQKQSEHSEPGRSRKVSARCLSAADPQGVGLPLSARPLPLIARLSHVLGNPALALISRI